MMFYYSQRVGRDRYRSELLVALERRFGNFTAEADLKWNGGFEKMTQSNWSVKIRDITQHRYASEIQMTCHSRELLEEMQEFLKPYYAKPLVIRMNRSCLDMYGQIPDEIKKWLDDEAVAGRFNTTFGKNIDSGDYQFLFTDKAAAMMFKLVWGGRI